MQSNKIKEQVNFEKSAFAPSIDIVGKTTWSKDVGGIEGSSQDAYLGLQLQWNLFNGNATSARHNSAINNHAASLDKYVDYSNKAKEAVRFSWNNYLTLFVHHQSI